MIELPLFVYGTLMTNGGQDHLLRGRRRRPGTVRGSLYQMPQGYPALTLAGDHLVHGQWLDPVPPPLMQILDTYEGVQQGLYRRAVVRVESGRASFDAWAWVMDEAQAHGGVPIRSGRWRRIRRR